MKLNYFALSYSFLVGVVLGFPLAYNNSSTNTQENEGPENDQLSTISDVTENYVSTQSSALEPTKTYFLSTTPYLVPTVSDASDNYSKYTRKNSVITSTATFVLTITLSKSSEGLPIESVTTQTTTSDDSTPSSDLNPPGSDLGEDFSQLSNLSSQDLAKMLSLMNQLRSENNKSPLVYNIDSIRASRVQSDYQYQIGKMTHDNSNFSNSLRLRVTSSGATCNGCAENVAFGQTSVESVFNAWKNSNGHFLNMIGDYKYFGFSKTGSYWTQIFNS
ncbi:hypothetical protein AYI68_g5455 [Smittium mucronatum]|uniref:SCP domain-containing protein n=1 Tax=Smittium mucronatum TaxID=133383 RepID=A0A1R0GUC5_9FUNG|nr:hypothetical protein AYI68_g6522 [Smittium mucronatum]OLY80448.1 hypothetical protein AYI68_g5455 [Smittium mucronatum]